MTIEERADAYVGHPEEVDEFTSETIKREAYIRGAKEQKAIDEEVRLKKCDTNQQKPPPFHTPLLSYHHTSSILLPRLWLSALLHLQYRLFFLLSLM